MQSFAVIPDHLFAPVRDMRTHRGQPFEGGKDFGRLAVLGRIDGLPLLIQILHPFLGKRGPNDETRQIFHGRIISGRDAVAVEAAIGHEDVGVRIDWGQISNLSPIAKRLPGDDGAGDGIRGHLAARCPHRLLEKDLQGFPGATAQACPREGGDRSAASCHRESNGEGSSGCPRQNAVGGPF